jgi:hypothetical protein
MIFNLQGGIRFHRGLLTVTDIREALDLRCVDICITMQGIQDDGDFLDFRIVVHRILIVLVHASLYIVGDEGVFLD